VIATGAGHVQETSRSGKLPATARWRLVDSWHRSGARPAICPSQIVRRLLREVVTGLHGPTGGLLLEADPRGGWPELVDGQGLASWRVNDAQDQALGGAASNTKGLGAVLGGGGTALVAGRKRLETAITNTGFRIVPVTPERLLSSSPICKWRTSLQRGKPNGCCPAPDEWLLWSSAAVLLPPLDWLAVLGVSDALFPGSCCRNRDRKVELLLERACQHPLSIADFYNPYGPMGSGARSAAAGAGLLRWGCRQSAPLLLFCRCGIVDAS